MTESLHSWTASWRVGWRHTLFVVIVLVLSVSLFHLRGLWPGRTFLPVDLADAHLPWRADPASAIQNPLISDPLYEFYPFLVAAVDYVRQTGRWFLWNPYIFLGHPSLADPLAQTFYPVYLGLGLLLGAARGYGIGLWLHATLAALLTYGFLRAIGSGTRAAILGALAYALGGYLVTWFETAFWTSTMAWLPGVLWAFELALQRRALRYASLSAGALALAALGGQFAFVTVFCLFLGLYALGRVIEALRQRGAAPCWPFGAYVVAVGLGGLAAAIQIAPFVEFFGLSQRNLAVGVRSGLPWRQLVTLIAPGFYGGPQSATPYWGALNYSEATLYAGIPALVLSLAALLTARRFYTRYIGLSALLLLWFIVGGPGVGVLATVPVLRDVSVHRALFLLPLVIAILAAKALDEPELSPRTAVGVAVGLAVVVAGVWYTYRGQPYATWTSLAKPLLRTAILLALTVGLLALRARASRRLIAEWALIVLLLADLFVWGGHFNPTGRVDQLLPPTRGVAYLQDHGGAGRTLVHQSDAGLLFGPNVLSVYGIAEAGGYSSIVSGRLHELVAKVQPSLGQNMIIFLHPTRRLCDLLQVAYVVAPHPFLDPGVRAEVLGSSCVSATREIGAADAISGTFLVRDTAINRLDVPIRVLRPPAAGAAPEVRLWPEADPAHPALDARAELENVADGQTLSFYFTPQRDAPGTRYAWEVAAGEPTGVALCADADGLPAVSVYGPDGAQVYDDEFYIFERFAPMPRAYIVYATEVIKGSAEAVDRLFDESFDLRNVAITASAIDLPSRPPLPADRAAVVVDQMTYIVVRATAAQRGLLVLGDQYHPGWRAYLDGQPIPLLRVNHILRGIVLPPGEHEVVFEFAPASLRVGGAISLIGGGCMLGLVLRPRRSKASL